MNIDTDLPPIGRRGYVSKYPEIFKNYPDIVYVWGTSFASKANPIASDIHALSNKGVRYSVCVNGIVDEDKQMKVLCNELDRLGYKNII